MLEKHYPKLAVKFIKKNQKNLIAVTGTNGKSSIADFYYQILKLNKKKISINRNIRH